jgi:ABC-type Zn2+ transport system substrate-binding protein/surface adhesin
VVSYGCQVKISSGPLDDFSEDPLDPETNSSNMAVVDTRPLFEDDVVSLHSQEAEEEYEQGTEDESEEDGSQRDSRQGQDESSDEDFDQHYAKWVSQDKKYMRWWRVG